MAVDDPLNQLHNRWYLESQTWVEDKIAEILGNLENDSYHENAYRGILLILMRLETIGFSKEAYQRFTGIYAKDYEKYNKLRFLMN